MYKLLNASLSDLWRTGQSAKIDMRMTHRIMPRPLLAQLADVKARNAGVTRRVILCISHSSKFGADWMEQMAASVLGNRIHRRCG
jgi:hypothetical protein